jgi:hypothetical protein
MFLSRSSQGAELDFCRIADTKTSLYPLIESKFYARNGASPTP